MKQGTVLNRIVMLLFLAAILLYFGGAAWRSFREPYPTVQAYSYQVDDTAETTGYLVRQEQVLTGTGGVVRVLPAEGEKVAAGATVAMLYADQDSVERSNRLEALTAEAKQMSAAIAGTEEQGQTGQGATETVAALRAAVEAGDFTHLESQTLTLRSAVYQQMQRYGSTEELSAALASTQQEIETLKTQTAQAIDRITVSQSGIFSGEVDGYEEILTPAMMESLTPTALDTLKDRAVSTDPAALGKLITDNKWYFVCPLDEAVAGRLTEGGTVTARFSRDWSGEVKMTVERIGAPENGRTAVILSSCSFLSDVTLLRRQTVDLVFSNRSGIRVPTQAVRMEEGVTGVYVQVGIKAEFKPVEILAQGEDYYLVQPKQEENAAAAQQKKALRAGDLIIVASREIWDGKVVT
ncbi:MAG: HlyD family efflux transporter periplasmic adaptor subunit [Pseudoflavonifractor sp.]|nr:HlyD family efflux transporter periplasmic adaptor subunit [Pseudoflavonifractor sp.]